MAVDGVGAKTNGWAPADVAAQWSSHTTTCHERGAHEIHDRGTAFCSSYPGPRRRTTKRSNARHDRRGTNGVHETARQRLRRTSAQRNRGHRVSHCPPATTTRAADEVSILCISGQQLCLAGATTRLWRKLTKRADGFSPRGASPRPFAAPRRSSAAVAGQRPATARTARMRSMDPMARATGPGKVLRMRHPLPSGRGGRQVPSTHATRTDLQQPGPGHRCVVHDDSPPFERGDVACICGGAPSTGVRCTVCAVGMAGDTSGRASVVPHMAELHACCSACICGGVSAVGSERVPMGNSQAAPAAGHIVAVCAPDKRRLTASAIAELRMRHPLPRVRGGLDRSGQLCQLQRIVSGLGNPTAFPARDTALRHAAFFRNLGLSQPSLAKGLDVFDGRIHGYALCTFA